MSIWVDKKYANLVSGSLLRFKWLSNTVANFRCPFCGDSSSNSIKARGYLFPKQQMYLYKCHRCAVSLPFGAFLKRLSRSLFDEYIMEKFDRTAPPLPEPELRYVRSDVRFTNHSQVLQLSALTLPVALHDVRMFVRDRRLPEIALQRLYGTSHARTWLTSLVGPEKAARVTDGMPYLVIPLRLPDKTWYGAQLRLITRKEYITFRWGHDALRTFGLDAWNPDALTYCVEGPLDALCLPNAIAFCGSDLLGGLERMKENDTPVKDRVLVWDNEPRNSQIAKHLAQAITLGERVVVWPRGLPKDVNDMLKADLDPTRIVSQYTFKGIAAQLEYGQWHK